MESESFYPSISELLNMASQVRNEMESKYGEDLAGHCIEASEEIVSRLSQVFDINVVTVEGWCRFDDDSYGSDRPWDPHTWVEIPSLNLYIDVTADQFNYGMARENEFSKIIVQEGLPHGMQYDEPVWEEDKETCMDPELEKKLRDSGMVDYESSFGPILVEPVLDVYRDGDNLSLSFRYYDDELEDIDDFGSITVNIEPLPYLHSCIDTNNNHGKIFEFLEGNGYGERTGRYLSSGWCRYPVFKFNEEKLKEIDPKTFAFYAKLHGRESSSLAEKIESARNQQVGPSQESGHSVVHSKEGR